MPTNRLVTKELAGLEDLLLGTGTVNQSRAGGTTPVTKIDATGLIYENAETLRTRFGKKVEVLTNVAALQLLVTATTVEKYIYLLGYTTAGDGGGGLFWLDSTDTTTVEDLNIVFNPDDTANGRWKRVDTDSYMSADRGDADYTIVGFDFGIQQYGTVLTANRTVTLPTSGLYKGKRVSVLRTALGSFNLFIGSIATLTGKGLVELQYDGSAWIILTEPSSSTSSSSGGTFNGSFEIDTNNDGQADNWNMVELVGATIEIDATDSAHGINSLKFLSGGNGGGSATSERFDVESGKQLRVLFTYKSSSATSLTKVNVNTYDRNGVLLSSLSAYSEGLNNPTTYKEQQTSVNIDTTAVTAEIVLTGIDTTSTTKAAGVTTNFDSVSYSTGTIPGEWFPVLDTNDCRGVVLVSNGITNGSFNSTWTRLTPTQLIGTGAKTALIDVGASVRANTSSGDSFSSIYVEKPGANPGLGTSGLFIENKPVASASARGSASPLGYSNNSNTCIVELVNEQLDYYLSLGLSSGSQASGTITLLGYWT